MLRMFRSARRSSGRNPVSTLAMAVALAGGTVAGTAVLDTPAHAQEYTEGFVEAYRAVEELTTGENPDYQAAKPLLPAVVAAVTNNDERAAAGSILLNVGQNLQDPALQRQGLELSLESGQVPPESQGQYNYFLGNLQLANDEFEAARQSLERAIDLGFTNASEDIRQDARTQIIQSYFREENPQAATEYVMGLIEELRASGQTPDERWLQFGLQGAYDTNDVEGVVDASEALIANYPSTENWTNSLLILTQIAELEDDGMLDLLRLMRETGSLNDRSLYIEYIETADPRLAANEVDDVLAEGVEKGFIDVSEEYHSSVTSTVETRAPQDREEADAIYAEAESSGDPMSAVEAGDLAYTLGDYSTAERMYAMAMEAGYADTARVLTRMGMSQLKQGNAAGAKETFSQVTGPREPVASMWSVYADMQGGMGG